MNDWDIEHMIKMFHNGVIRRCGVRVDAVTCGELLAMLKELQKRRIKGNDKWRMAETARK